VKLLLAIPWFAWLLVAANLAMLGGPADYPYVNIIVQDLKVPSGRTLHITVADFADVVTGFTVTISTAKRDFTTG